MLLESILSHTHMYIKVRVIIVIMACGVMYVCMYACMYVCICSAQSRKLCMHSLGILRMHTNL